MVDSQEQTFADRAIPMLVRLCHELLDADSFGDVESLANLLVALRARQWELLPVDEKAFWVRKASGMLRKLGATHSSSLVDAVKALLDRQAQTLRELL